LLFCIPLLAAVSPGQEPPACVTVPASALGTGNVLVSYGADLGVKNGVAAGEPARLWRVLPVTARVGVSSNVDVTASWRGRLIARSSDGAPHADWGDPSLFTKVTLTDSGATPAAAVSFGFKVPSTRYLPHRLGSDAADLYFRALGSTTFSGGEVRFHLGAAIVGDPRFTGSQDDMLTGSVMLIVRPAGGWDLFGELHGFTGPKEEDDKLQLRGGAGVDAGFGTVSVYGNARLAGSAIDFGTAFEATGSWGVGLSVTHRLRL